MVHLMIDEKKDIWLSI